MLRITHFRLFFFFNDTATTEIYTLSLHDALPISPPPNLSTPGVRQSTTQLYTIKPGDTPQTIAARLGIPLASLLKSKDRKSTRLNSSHSQISYAVFCLKKKKSRRHVQAVWQI